MSTFKQSLALSALGREVNLPICFLPGEKGIELFYTYYQGKSLSHRFEFRRGNRAIFEILLPHYEKNMIALCTVLQGRGLCPAGEEKVFSLWTRLALWLTAGKPIFCAEIAPGLYANLHLSFAEASSVYCYRLALCRKGAQEAIVLISSKHSRQSGCYRQGQSTKFNYLKLTMDGFNQLIESLTLFMDRQVFANVRQNIK
ncbi:hypothetical protein [Psychromonas sp.]|uniref:hypothetical protein n=1 Tax=Psychromonas sp. TaxID=1884585 RepID=UPI00356845D9